MGPCRVFWRKRRPFEPGWKIEHGYNLEIDGMALVRTKLEVFTPKDFKAKSLLHGAGGGDGILAGSRCGFVGE